MEVEILRSRDELEETKPFRVETLLWGTKKIPETFGYLGYVPGEGFYLKMVCVEKDPLRTYIADQDPVYQDSAMEAFLQFESAREREDSPIYMNFEVNANGALLAGYGTSRIYRSYFSKEDLEEIGCRRREASSGATFIKYARRHPMSTMRLIPRCCPRSQAFICRSFLHPQSL